MLDIKISELVERQFAARRVLDQVRSATHCGQPMSGGPVVLSCVECGHTVHVSHLDREVPYGGGPR